MGKTHTWNTIQHIYRKHVSGTESRRKREHTSKINVSIVYHHDILIVILLSTNEHFKQWSLHKIYNLLLDIRKFTKGVQLILCISWMIHEHHERVVSLPTWSISVPVFFFCRGLSFTPKRAFQINTETFSAFSCFFRTFSNLSLPLPQVTPGILEQTTQVSA